MSRLKLALMVCGLLFIASVLIAKEDPKLSITPFTLLPDSISYKSGEELLLWYQNLTEIDPEARVDIGEYKTGEYQILVIKPLGEGLVEHLRLYLSRPKYPKEGLYLEAFYLTIESEYSFKKYDDIYSKDLPTFFGKKKVKSEHFWTQYYLMCIESFWLGTNKPEVTWVGEGMLKYKADSGMSFRLFLEDRDFNTNKPRPGIFLTGKGAK